MNRRFGARANRCRWLERGMDGRRRCRSFAILSLALAPLLAAAPCRGQTFASPTLSRDMIGPDMPAEIRTQVERLYSSNPDECLAGIRALRAMGPAAAPAAPFLASMLDGHFGSEQPNEAGHVLHGLGKAAVEPLNLALFANASEARRRAAYVIGLIRDERSIEPLIASFAAGLGVRPEMGALRRLGEPARERVFAALRSNDVNRRLAAAQAILAFSTMPIGHRFLANDGGGAIPVPAGWTSQPVIEALLNALGDEDRRVRLECLKSLTTLAAAGRDERIPLSDSLRAALADPDVEIRRAALALTTRTAGDAKIEALAARLSDEDPTVCEAALREMTWIRDDRALDAIARLLETGDRALIPLAAYALGAGGRARDIPSLAALLDSRDPAARAEAAMGLGKLRAAAHEGRLLLLLQDEALTVRLAAALALARCGGKPAAEALIRLTDDGDPTVRYNAMWALAERCEDRRDLPSRSRRFLPMGLGERDRIVSGLQPLAPAGADAFPYGAVVDRFVAILEGPRTDLHGLALEAVVAYAAAGPALDRALIAAIRSPDLNALWIAMGTLLGRRTAPDSRFLAPLREAVGNERRALSLLARMGDAQTVIPTCERMLRDPYSRVGCTAIGLLNELGEPGLDLLKQHLGDPRPDVRGSAGEALAARMGDPRVNAFVRAAAGSSNPHLRDGALAVVSRNAKTAARSERVTPEMLAAAWGANVLDPDDANRRALLALGSAALPAVTAMLGAADRETRSAAAELAGAIGDPAAVPALAAAMKDAAASVRAQAAASLGRLGGADAVAALLRGADDPEPGVAETALAALAARREPSAASPLIAALDHAVWTTRRVAAEGLGAGVADARVPAALARALERDPHWAVRRAAGAALGRAGDAAVLPVLIAALDDPHWLVRAAAHGSLTTLAKRDAPPDPAAWRVWWNGREKTP